ncbi:MAG: hypothetical protein HKN20_05800 [Gemmatimonadetes bacterium]|nr:hypothetical protein [Gemmatimonadota bacterium]
MNLPVALSAQEESQAADSASNSGLQIHNEINRGVTYIDSLGAGYNLRYIPVTITNDSSAAIHLQLSFSSEYRHPPPDTNETFQLIPLPEEWARGGAGVTDSMLSEVPNYIAQPAMNATIEPGGELVLGIATLYATGKTRGILPRTLFLHQESGMFPTCDWFMEDEPTSDSTIALGLKLVTGDYCMVIPCGRVSDPHSEE